MVNAEPAPGGRRGRGIAGRVVFSEKPGGGGDGEGDGASAGGDERGGSREGEDACGSDFDSILGRGGARYKLDVPRKLGSGWLGPRQPAAD